MICERGKTSVVRLRKYDLTCMYIMLVSLILISASASIYTPAIDITAMAGVGMCIIVAVFIFYALLYGVMARIMGKLDFSESLSTNIRLASRYKMLLLIREGIGLLILIPIVISVCYRAMQTQDVESITMSVYIILALVGGIVFVWKYLQNLGLIFNCLNELRSLKEGKEE